MLYAFISSADGHGEVAQLRVVCGRGRDPTLSGCPPVAAFRFRGRGPRSGRCGLRSGVPRRPARRRRTTRSSSWPAGWFAGARRTCGPGPLRPWRFSRSRSATGRASRSASRCGRANRADLCQTAPASRRATAPSPLDLQRDALRAARVDDVVNLYHDFASGLRDDRPGLDSSLRVLRKGDVRVVWKLDRLGRNLAHLVKHRAGSVGLRGGPAGARRPGGADRHHDRDRTGSCSASSRRWPSSSGS